MFLLLLSRACTESRPFLLLTPPHQRAGWGCTRSWEVTWWGQLTPTDQRDILCHMVSCSVQKLGEEGGSGRRHSEWQCLSPQVTVTRDGAPLSRRWLNTGLPLGSRELIPCFSLLLCVAFALLELSLTQSTSSHFCPSNSQAEWVSGCVGLSCWLGLNHNTTGV